MSGDLLYGQIGSYFVPYYDISIPNPTPFYPTVKKEDEKITVSFSQGHVIQISTGSQVDVYAVNPYPTGYDLSSGRYFYVDSVPWSLNMHIVQKQQPVNTTINTAKGISGLWELATFSTDGTLEKLVLRNDIVIGGYNFYLYDDDGRTNIFTHAIKLD